MSIVAVVLRCTNAAEFELTGGVRRTNGSRCIYDFHSSSDRPKTGRFFSPRYPQHYPPFANCQYFFHALPRENVKVTFDSIELELTSGRWRSVFTHNTESEDIALCQMLPHKRGTTCRTNWRLPNRLLFVTEFFSNYSLDWTPS